MRSYQVHIAENLKELKKLEGKIVRYAFFKYRLLEDKDLLLFDINKKN